MNPHPIIFPKLIALYNKEPRAYYDYMNRWMTRGQAKEILVIIYEWTKREGYNGEYLNEE